MLLVLKIWRDAGFGDVQDVLLVSKTCCVAVAVVLVVLQDVQCWWC